MAVEFDPSNFNLERLKTNYLDFEVVSLRQKSTVTASPKYAAGGVVFEWAICCSLWWGVGWPRFTPKPRNTHLEGASSDVPCSYSPTLVEAKFCELRLCRVPGRAAARLHRWQEVLPKSLVGCRQIHRRFI